MDRSTLRRGRGRGRCDGLIVVRRRLADGPAKRPRVGQRLGQSVADPGCLGRRPLTSAGPLTSTVPAPSPPPELVRNGDLPTPAKVMIQTAGSYRVVDLTTGTLGPESLLSGIGRATVLVRPGGGWVCICEAGMSPQVVDAVTRHGRSERGPAERSRGQQRGHGRSDPPQGYQGHVGSERVRGDAADHRGCQRDHDPGWPLRHDRLDLSRRRARAGSPASMSSISRRSRSRVPRS